MSKVVVNSGTLTISISNSDSDNCDPRNISIDFTRNDFNDSKIAIKSVELTDAAIGDSYNGIFEYEISFEDDFEDVETDSISLIPFDLTVLDYTRPICVSDMPSSNRSLVLKFKSKSTDAISKIIGASNMHLIADKDSFELQGVYNKIPIVIKGEASSSKVWRS